MHYRPQVSYRDREKAGSCNFCTGGTYRKVYEITGNGIMVRFCTHCYKTIGEDILQNPAAFKDAKSKKGGMEPKDVEPCPFCRELDFSFKGYDGQTYRYTQVACDACGASGPRAPSQSESIRLWNAYGKKRSK